MKVLHILNELNPSGAETMLLCASTYLQQRGVESDILATGDRPGVFAPALEKAGYRIHHIKFKKNIHFFIALYRFLKNGNYDSVHLHTERASFWLTIIVLLAGIPAKRCVRTIHNTFAFTGNLGWRRAWQRQLLCYLGVPHIAISKSVQETEREHYKIDTAIIQNWYDSNRFTQVDEARRRQSRQSLQLAENDFVVVTVGNCSVVKNHTALINAIATLGREDVVYLHIGIEKDAGEQNLASELGIKNQIRFLGQQNDILPYLYAADLYVMPSTYEGFGIAAIEAIATEVPVLLSNVPGLKDFSTMFNGIYYCEPTAESVAAVLKQVLSVPLRDLREAVAGNAKTAAERFGIERGVSEYVSLYQG